MVFHNLSNGPILLAKSPAASGAAAALQDTLSRRFPVSLRPQPPLPPVPDETARVAQAAFPRGNPYVLLQERLGAVFADTDFIDLYKRLGQPAYARPITSKAGVTP